MLLLHFIHILKHYDELIIISVAIVEISRHELIICSTMLNLNIFFSLKSRKIDF